MEESPDFDAEDEEMEKTHREERREKSCSRVWKSGASNR
jgi:hypothetical protein